MKTSNFFIFLIFLVFISGCDKPNQTPELLDKVYLELNHELKEAERSRDDKQKELTAIMKTIETLIPRSRESRVAWETNHRLKKEISKAEQDILYLRLRIHSRLVQDRKDYMEARRTKSVWPKSQSFDNYVLQRKLASASRTWSRSGPERKADEKKNKKQRPKTLSED